MTRKRDLETSKQTAARIAELAQLELARHQLITVADNIWSCQAPGTGLYGFKIMTGPGVIVMWGDLGSLVIDAGINYDLKWARTAIRSRNYFLEKCGSIRRDTYYPGNFRELLTYHEASNQEMALARADDYNESSYQNYINSHGYNDDSVYDYGIDTFWRLEAMTKFLDMLPDGV